MIKEIYMLKDTVEIVNPRPKEYENPTCGGGWEPGLNDHRDHKYHRRPEAGNGLE